MVLIEHDVKALDIAGLAISNKQLIVDMELARFKNKLLVFGSINELNACRTKYNLPKTKIRDFILSSDSYQEEGDTINIDRCRASNLVPFIYQHKKKVESGYLSIDVKVNDKHQLIITKKFKETENKIKIFDMNFMSFSLKESDCINLVRSYIVGVVFIFSFFLFLTFSIISDEDGHRAFNMDGTPKSPTQDVSVILKNITGNDDRQDGSD